MLRRCLFLFWAGLLVGCQPAPPAPSPTPVSTPTPYADQQKAGKRLFRQHCTHCHEQESGEGPKLKGKVLATHGSAARLFRYNKKYMPYGLDMRLSDQEYWAITAYLLSKTELAVFETDLGPDNAESVKLEIPE